MTRKRKIAFAVITLLVICGVVEGASQIIWWRLARKAFAACEDKGKQFVGDPNNGLRLMEMAHPIYYYTLKPGYESPGLFVNEKGFAQRDVVPLAKANGVFRVAAQGESTTHGHNVDTACYPTYLRKILHSAGHEQAEVINGGVSGWLSDQVALRAENELAAYQPDLVVLYTGWNDFQAYDPLSNVAKNSMFEMYGGSHWHSQLKHTFKSFMLLDAVYEKAFRKEQAAKGDVKCADATPAEIYRFYLKNLDRMLAAYRNENPKAVVALCTLVGRWPSDSDEQFETAAPTFGHIWWMKQHKLNRHQAAERLNIFNDLLRNHAKSKGFVLVDCARAFDNLNRTKLQWDFCHFNEEGYELLAEVMYDSLREQGFVRGEARSRLAELMAKHQQPTNVTRGGE